MQRTAASSMAPNSYGRPTHGALPISRGPSYSKEHKLGQVPRSAAMPVAAWLRDARVRLRQMGPARQVVWALVALTFILTVAVQVFSGAGRSGLSLGRGVDRQLELRLSERLGVIDELTELSQQAYKAKAEVSARQQRLQEQQDHLTVQQASGNMQPLIAATLRKLVDQAGDDLQHAQAQQATATLAVQAAQQRREALDAEVAALRRGDKAGSSKLPAGRQGAQQLSGSAGGATASPALGSVKQAETQAHVEALQTANHDEQLGAAKQLGEAAPDALGSKRHRGKGRQEAPKEDRAARFKEQAGALSAAIAQAHTEDGRGPRDQQAVQDETAQLQGQGLAGGRLPTGQPSPQAAAGADVQMQDEVQQLQVQQQDAPRIGSEAADDSLRCRVGGICEGRSACKQEDDLGCVTSLLVRQQHIRAAMNWTWKGYRDFAWGEDELLPLSRSHSKWFGLGLTLVDSLDTLLLMGLREEFEAAREWVSKKLQLDQDTTVNLFETTIRILGSLLTCFYLAEHDPIFRDAALELGMRMTPAFQSKSGVPFSDVNLHKLEAKSPDWGADSSLSEVTSLSLEFTTLGNAAGFHELGDMARDVVASVASTDGCQQGLCPVWINPNTGAFHGMDRTLGARGDSYYEYLVKQWILTGKTDGALLRQYTTAMQGVRDQLLRRTRAGKNGLLYVGELRGNHFMAKMDHLVCFLPGVLALGHLHGVNTAANVGADPSDLQLAEDLMATCYEMYRRVPAGLAPEIVHFTQHAEGHATDPEDVGGGDFTVKQMDSHNLLRPETVESLFVLAQVTGKAQYQEWGWHIFRAWEKFSRVDTGGYANLDSVLQVPPPRRDKMESFWPGEALKYLYLLFDGSAQPRLSLREWVFNTEAHPLPVMGSPAELRARPHYLKEADVAAGLAGFRHHQDTQQLADWLKSWQQRG